MTEEEYYGPFYILELTQRCNHSCSHCYNVWKLDSKYPRGELNTSGWKRLIDKLKDETNCRFITLSGGEPFMREDFFEILYHLSTLEIATALITNGSLLTPEKIRRCLDHGVMTMELPLLSHKRDMHDAMSGVPCFDKVLNSIIEIKEQKGRVVSVFVATKKNIRDFEKTVELAFALGVNGIMLNRFNAGGAAVKIMEELTPSLESLRTTLEVAERLSGKYYISISCAIPMQPCLFDFSLYPRLGSGFCSAGTERAYYTIDSLGNIRPCNHSSLVAGNFLEETLPELLAKQEMKSFANAFPTFCMPCAQRNTCLGGCKAAAEVCFGKATEIEPFLKLALVELGDRFSYPVI